MTVPAPSEKRRRLPPRHRAWIQAKVAVAVWLLSYAILTPPATAAVLGAFVWTWVAVAVAGIVASIAGMFLALRTGRAVQGRVIELTGLIVACAGPLIHAITMVTIMWPLFIAGEDWAGRVGPLAQSVVIAMLLRVRYVEVRDRIPGGR